MHLRRENILHVPRLLLFVLPLLDRGLLLLPNVGHESRGEGGRLSIQAVRLTHQVAFTSEQDSIADERSWPRALRGRVWAGRGRLLLRVEQRPLLACVAQCPLARLGVKQVRLGSRCHRYADRRKSRVTWRNLEEKGRLLAFAQLHLSLQSSLQQLCGVEQQREKSEVSCSFC